MDSRCMSMRFPVLDRIKMSAALPHPVPPLSYTESKTYDAGVFPVLNNFKSHRPTDSYPRLHRSSTAFTAISDQFSGSGWISWDLDFSPREIYPYDSSRRNGKIIRRSAEPFLDQFCSRLEKLAIGPNSGEKRYLSLKNTCIVRWKRTNRAFHSW